MIEYFLLKRDSNVTLASNEDIVKIRPKTQKVHPEVFVDELIEDDKLKPKFKNDGLEKDNPAFDISNMAETKF